MKADMSYDRPTNRGADARGPKPLHPVVAPFAIVGLAILVMGGGIWILAFIAAAIGTIMCHQGSVPAYKCSDSRPAAPRPPRNVDLQVEWIKAIDKTTYSEHPESCWNDPNPEFRVLFRNNGADQVDPRSVQIKLIGSSNDRSGLKSVTAETTALGAVGTGIGTNGDGYGVGMMQVTIPPDLRDKPLVWTVTVANQDDRNQDNNSMSVVLGPCPGYRG